MNQHSSGPLETILYVVVALLTAGVMGLAGHREPAPQIAEIAPKFQSDPDTLEPAAKPPAAEQHDAGQDAPAVEWLTLEEAQASGRPYFVFQHYADPALDRGCRPCRVIEKLMRDPDVVAIFTAHGVLTSGTVEDWQKGSPLPVAPAIGYVVPEAKEGDAVPIIKGLDPPRVPTGFRLESKEAFISDIEAWIDKQQ